MLTADGFDQAICGVLRRCGQPDIVVYSYAKAVDVLIGRGATHEEAVEYLEFNCVGAWVGEETPGWLLEDLDELEELGVPRAESGEKM